MGIDRMDSQVLWKETVFAVTAGWLFRVANQKPSNNAK